MGVLEDPTENNKCKNNPNKCPCYQDCKKCSKNFEDNMFLPTDMFLLSCSKYFYPIYNFDNTKHGSYLNDILLIVYKKYTFN